MGRDFTKELANKRKNFKESLLARSIDPIRSEKITANIHDRRIPDSLMNTIINSSGTVPAYIFSTDASYVSFKEYADAKAASYVSGMNTKIKDVYNQVPEIKDRITAIENLEKNLAKKLCDAYGFEITGDPRTTFKQKFMEFMNGTTVEDNAEIKALIDTNAETIALEMVRDKFEEEITNKVYESPKRLKTQSTNIINRDKQASGDRDLARKLIERSDIANASLLYQRVQQASKLAQKYNKTMDFISKGKGIVQELRTAELMRYFLRQENNVKKQVQQVLVNPLGNKANEEKIAGEVGTSLMSAIQKGIDTRGGSDKISTTDLSFDVITNTNEILKLNVDVKSSVTKKYVKHSFKFSSEELRSSVLPGRSMFNLGMLAIINNTNVEKTVSRYKGLDQASRPLVSAALTNFKFLDSFIPKIEEVTKPDFQNLIMLDDKLFWYSELIKSIPENVVQTVSNKKQGKSSFYDFTMMLDDYQPLQSLISSQSQHLLSAKRRVIRQKAIRENKLNYAERYPYLMKDKKVLGLLKQYQNAANSLSFNIAFKFDIYNTL